MVDVQIAVASERYEAALAEGMAKGLIPRAEEVFAMNEEEARQAAALVVLAVLAPEIRWMEDRGIDCVITATEIDNVFVLGFETVAEAALFRLAWASETGEETRARSLVH